MEHEIYLALLELNEKVDYIYQVLKEKGLVKEEEAKEEDKEK